MVTFVNLSPAEEESRRAKLLEGYTFNQSWINPDGTKTSVSFKTLSERLAWFDNGALYVARYQNAKTGKIYAIMCDLELRGNHNKQTMLGTAQAHGRLYINGYLNNELAYSLEWNNRSSNPLNGFMSQSDALAMCKRSLEDKMKLEARGE